MVNVKVNLGGLEMPTFLATASGTFGYGFEYVGAVDYSKLGAVTAKGIRVEPWPGNEIPRHAEVPGGLVNAIGLQGTGVEHFLKYTVPWYRQQVKGVPLIANIWGASVEGYAEVAAKMGDAVDAVGQAADDMWPVALQFSHQKIGIVAADRGGSAGAHYGNRAFRIEVGRAETIEQHRTVVGFGTVESGGVSGVGKEERSDMVAFAETQLFFSPGERALVEYVLGYGPMRSESGIQFGFGQGKDVFIGVDFYKPPDRGVSKPCREDQCYLR